MKNLILLLGLLILIGCSEKESPAYSIISINSSSQKIGSFVEGDVIENKEVVLHLIREESILINEVKTGKVFRVSGPFTGPFSSIQKSKFEVFNKKYFSLIKENLRKPEKEIKQAVLGGVFRASPIRINYIDGEVVDVSEISLEVIEKRPEDCIIKIFNDNLLVHTCIENAKCVFNFEELRNSEKTIEYKVQLNCGMSKSETFINVASKNETKRFLMEEKEISDVNFPLIGKINFYLENKRFSLAKKLIDESESNSEMILKLKTALE